jgi:phosphate starvation-inducible protein PhoH
MSKLKAAKKKRVVASGDESLKKPSFDLKPISPLTENQKRAFAAYHKKNLFLHGIAGTGKTFISFYLALRDILGGNSPYKKLYVMKSIVPSRDIGFLPGSAQEKMAVYEAPYYAICQELFGSSLAYENLKKSGKIEFLSTSYVRGITLADCVVLVDEVQNQNAQELNSVITRVGSNCKIIFAGDLKQNDLVNRRELSGLADFMKIIKRMTEFTFVEFGIDDILRSDLVRSYIIARNNLEEEQEVKPL